MPPPFWRRFLDGVQVVATQTYDGDATRFRLAIEAMRLGLAYEYDPYFALSIARRACSSGATPRARVSISTG